VFATVERAPESLADRIARIPGVATVETHRARIFDKLGVSNRLELALYAVNRQLLSQRPVLER